MNKAVDFEALEVGFDVPATVGMDEAEIQTPCLVVDLDALENNIRKMGEFAKAHNIRHRVHGKMHKSVDVAKLQERLGGACGVCCQKVSEAEVFARGGIKDVMVSNQVRDPLKIDRLAQIPKLGARAICCVDDIENIPDLSAAAVRHGTQIESLPLQMPSRLPRVCVLPACRPTRAPCSTWINTMIEKRRLMWLLPWWQMPCRV